jgi:O-antigen ligase
VALLAVVIPVARIITSGWRPPAVQARVWLPTALLLLWSLLSLAWNDSAGAWASGFLALCLGFAYMVLFAVFINNPQQLYRLLRTFAITGIVVGILSALLFFFLHKRANGFTGGPNDYAVLNVMAIPVCVVLASRERGKWRWFFWAGIPIFFVATLASESRSGLIGVFVIGFFCCAARPSMTIGQRARWAVAALVAAVVGFLVAGVIDPTRFSLAGFVSDRGGGRLDIWTAAILGLRTHWLLGYGLGGFQKHALELIQRATGASLDVARNPGFKDSSNIPAHNLFFNVVLDLGVIGVVLYFGTILVAIKNLIDMLKTEWREIAWIGLGAMVAIIATGPFASALNPKLQWAFTGLPAAYFVRRNLTERTKRKSLHLTGSVAHGDH